MIGIANQLSLCRSFSDAGVWMMLTQHYLPVVIVPRMRTSDRMKVGVSDRMRSYAGICVRCNVGIRVRCSAGIHVNG
jgi:hypothetical protein